VATGGQKTVELLLIHLVHVQQSIGGAAREGGVFDILAENSRALFFTASEEVSTRVAGKFRLVFLAWVEIVCHCFLLSLSTKRSWFASRQRKGKSVHYSAPHRQSSKRMIRRL
jgi:hypothetical protein